MAEKTQLKISVPTKDTSSSEVNFIVASDYDMTCDNIRMKRVPYQGYVDVDLVVII